MESVVIPCAGEKYATEAGLSAKFAANNLLDAQEIIIATNLTADAFGKLPDKVRVETIMIPPEAIPTGHSHANIWRSRLVKLRAPALARHDVILMIDSDLVLLRNFRARVISGVVFGTLYRGKIGHRIKKYRRQVAELRRAPRLRAKWHVNGGLLLADRATWKALTGRWLAHYDMLWRKLPHETPVDQIPLVMALDELGFLTVDLGPFVNWSVPKRIGGAASVIPPTVVGAHGGFPLSEWEKYLADPQTPLNFLGEDYTRKARYQKGDGRSNGNA